MSGGDFLGLVVVAVVLYLLIRLVYAMTAGNYRRMRHEANAEQIANKLFDGSPAVTYVSPDDTGGLALETLVEFANRHGYRLVTESGRGSKRRAVFERREVGN